MRQRGWRVFATARKPEDLARLEAEGVEAIFLDYADPSSVTACATEVAKRTDGRLDALFNNGAYAEFIRIPGRIVQKNLYKIPAHVDYQDAALAEPFFRTFCEEQQWRPPRRLRESASAWRRLLRQRACAVCLALEARFPVRRQPEPRFRSNTADRDR